MNVYNSTYICSQIDQDVKLGCKVWYLQKEMVTRKFGGNVQCKFQTLDGLCLCKEACKETRMEKKRGVKHLGWKLGVQ